MTTKRDQPDDSFPITTAGLPEARPTGTVRLRDGERLKIHIHPVRKHIADSEVRMLSYNGSIPGPTLEVDQGSEVTVEILNDSDDQTTVHWHGLRLENRFDGVPHDTQAPIPVGGTFTYKVQFPDAGVYWYHPHLREDFAQEMGLYGAIVVRPSDVSFWPPADREITLTLDDLLMEDDKIAEFKRSGPNYTAMGRFGNVLLINGETQFEGDASVGEVVRLYLINTANTRIFNFGVTGARMKLVGGDSGRYERESFVDDVLIAPSERAVVDVLFDSLGRAKLEHRTPDKVYDLGAFSVGTSGNGDAPSFSTLRVDEELANERESTRKDLERPPDKTIALVATMPLLYGAQSTQAATYACPMHPDVVATTPGNCPQCGMKLIPQAAAIVYACPMHPEVTATEPSTCPQCGMKLVPQAAQPVPTTYYCPMHPEVTATEPSTCPQCGMKLVPQTPAAVADSAKPDHAKSAGHHDAEQSDGLEWEDLMPDINRASNPSNMFWKIIDRDTGLQNAEISWTFKVGDRVKIRLINEMESDHPMHHPFHIHGAGRFLVLSRDNEPEPNLVWKDTVLVRAGETVDILLDVSNPGRWMAHCHIAEHIESGMMFSFDVLRT
jgi:FtsP/CotA-like multicopper oxidase with cupredoxin domain